LEEGVMIAIVVVGMVCLTVAHWVRQHSGMAADDRPSSVLTPGGRSDRNSGPGS
jgi:hypothetical protein